jgi:hypothetical protein
MVRVWIVNSWLDTPEVFILIACTADGGNRKAKQFKLFLLNLVDFHTFTHAGSEQSLGVWDGWDSALPW